MCPQSQRGKHRERGLMREGKGAAPVEWLIKTLGLSVGPSWPVTAETWIFLESEKTYTISQFASRKYFAASVHDRGWVCSARK